MLKWESRGRWNINIAIRKKCGHPYYQDFDDLITYEKRCRELDEQGYQMLFGDEEEQNNVNDEEMESDEGEEEDNEEITKDTIRKHQFDHNRNTAMTHNYPEMSTDENGRCNRELFFDPAEGNHPINLQEEKDWDLKSWPALLPEGKFGLHHKRKVRLTEQQYFCQRILHTDGRFSRSPGYIFAAAAYIEQKQLTSKANISFMRGGRSSTTE